MITYEKPENILLLGGGRTMWEFHDWLTAKGYSVLAITAPRQATPQAHHSVRVMDSLDTLFLPTGPSSSMAICFGPAWPIPARLRESFGNRLLDFMSIPFPAYLGGAHETWADLHGEKTWGCCLQLVTENTVQGVMHDGQVISRSSFPYADRYGQYLSFLKAFIVSIESGTPLIVMGPDHSPAFFPRLNTGQNGWIDWSWSAHEICRFINAFAPYGGAGTYCDGQELRITHAAHQGGLGFHPYTAGIVLSFGGITRVACRDGILHIAYGNHGPLMPGNRLHTPREKLEEALLYRPEYDAKGDTAIEKQWCEKIGTSMAQQAVAHLSPEQVREILGDGVAVWPVPAKIAAVASTGYFATDPLSIRLLRPEDVSDRYVGWLNDPEVNRYLEVRHRTWERNDVLTWVEDEMNKDSALFGIFVHDRHIGNLKIGPVNRHHHYADLSYFIGEKAEWGKGYATKAVKLAIEWARKNMNLHRLQAGVYDSNAASAEVLRKCGFEYECFFGKQLLDNGVWQDHNFYVLTNPDWKP